MARPLRIQFPGALYHVMSRGNEKQAIVRDDIDRAKRVDWLRRTVEIYGWRLHAFALMTNHEHLFVETPEANLSSGMQYLGGSYTSYFNWRYKRSGHLFQGRFKAHLVQTEGYFRQVSRYIHLNPVRAGMIDLPQDYQWSSYSGYAQARRAVAWICYDRVLSEFGDDLSEARQAYGRFVQAGIDNPPSSPLSKAVGGLLLGSAGFVAINTPDASRSTGQCGPTAVEGSSTATASGTTANHRGCRPLLWMRPIRLAGGQAGQQRLPCVGGLSGQTAIRISGK
jgi:putative transposase